MLGLIAAAALVVLAQRAPAQEPFEGAVDDIDQVKAEFLYHFGTYVMWPRPAEETDAITIAVLGDDNVAAQLEQYLPGRRIAGRRVEARRLERIDELADDEIVFIGRSGNERLPQLIAAIGDRPSLIVTDAPDGLEQGSMVNFQQIDARLRFEISVPRAEAAGLTLSSRLLSAALRVVTAECCARPGSRGLARVSRGA